MGCSLRSQNMTNKLSIEEHNLENGMKLIYVHDKEVPLTRVSLNTLYGSLNSMPQNSAEYYHYSSLGSFAGTLLRNGGTKRFSPEKFDRRLMELGASIESSISITNAKFGFECLSDDLPEVDGLFYEMLTEPAFNQEKFEVMKLLTLDSIKRRREDNGRVGEIVEDTFLFPNSALSYNETTEGIAKIHANDVKKWYDSFLDADGTVLTIVSDFPLAALQETIIAKYENLPTKGGKLSLEEFTPKQPKYGTYLVKGDYQTANVVMSQYGVKGYTEDHFAIKVFNRLFGNGMSSRLYQKVRTDEGLVYVINGGITAGRVAGSATISFEASGNLHKAISVSLATLAEMQTELVTATELQEVKDALTNSFVFANASEDQVVARQVSKELLGFPDDYENIFIEGINKVTAEDVLNVAKTRFTQDFVIVIVGSEADLKKYVDESGIKDYKYVEFDEVPVLKN